MRTKELLKLLNEQAKWVESCGGDLAGYVAHYGSKDDPDHFGHGGEAIYAADKGAYDKLMLQAIKRGLFRRNV